jgi:hypothetical protein
MKIISPLSFVLVSSLAALACSGGGSSSSSSAGAGAGGGAGGIEAGGLPCDVEEVLEANCQKCHSDPPVFGAPMPLMRHADLMAPAFSDAKRKVYELVGERIHDAAAPMPQPPNDPLDEAETKVIDSWVAAGAPSASKECGGGGGGGGSGPAVGCTPDISLKGSKAWTMPKEVPDEYVCYGVDVTPAQKSQLIGFVPRIDNKTIVHHVLLYQATSTVSPDPTPCSGGGKAEWRIAAVWAPGGEAVVLPPEVGIPLEDTTHYVVQIHYSNLMKLDGQTDTSGFDLCSTTDLRPNEGDILAFGTTNISIPAAGSTDVTCDFEIPAGQPERKIVAGMPHMHKLGTVISTTNLPGGSGAPVDLGTRNPWSFDAQYWTTLDASIKSGDKIRTRCAWNNPGATQVGFGEDTSDEMCYSFAIYYPRITSVGWNWMIPAIASKCSTTPK